MKVHVELLTVNNAALSVEFEESYLLEELADDIDMEYDNICEQISNGTFTNESELCDMIETHYECGWTGNVIMTGKNIDVDSCKDDSALTIKVLSDLGYDFSDIVSLITGTDFFSNKDPNENEYILSKDIPRNHIVAFQETIAEINNGYTSIDNVIYTELESKILMHLLTYETYEYFIVDFEKIRLGAFYIYGIGHPS